jgi:hypothetical protein
MAGAFRIALLGLVGLALALPPPAQAQRRTGPRVQKAQALVDRGDRLFDQKRYEEAIAEYTAALAMVPHPDLVWNIARSNEELKRHSQAVAFFRRYRDMDVGTSDQSAADKRIKALEGALVAATRGSLKVTTPHKEAVVTVGGIEVGRGRAVLVKVRPGLYRIRVELAGYETFETKARIAPGGVAEVAAKLQRTEPRAVLVVQLQPPGVDGAAVSIDEGRAEPVGIPIPLDGGAHKLRVTAPRYEPVEKLIEARPGQKTVVTIAMGPARPPVQYASRAGQYRLFGRTAGAVGRAVEGGQLTLDTQDKGTARVSRRMPLAKWRRSACGGAEDVTWTEVWTATLDPESGRLNLGKPQLESCSCDVWCKATGELSLEAWPLPGNEGLVGDQLVALRSSLLSKESGAFGPPDLDTLKGQWEIVRWSIPRTRPQSIVIAPSGDAGRGVLDVRRDGMIASFQRTLCPGVKRFEQVAEYPLAVAVVGDHFRLSFDLGREASCTCPGACGAPPPLADTTLRLLAVDRYAIGPGVVVRRAE